MTKFYFNIDISFNTQILATVVYLIAIILLLTAPWPYGYWPIWLLACILVIVEFFRCQKRIAKTKGQLIITHDYSVFWQGSYWVIVGNPLITHYFIYFMLESKDPIRPAYQRLWLMRDCVTHKREWHSLIYLFVMRNI